MSSFTLVSLLFICLVIMLTVWVSGVLDQPKNSSAESDSTRESKPDKKPSSSGTALKVLLAMVIGLGFALYRVNSVAPPEYISKKVAQSNDPECLQNRLGNILQKQALSRNDIIRAEKICKSGSRKDVPIRLLQKEALADGKES